MGEAFLKNDLRFKIKMRKDHHVAKETVNRGSISKHNYLVAVIPKSFRSKNLKTDGIYCLQPCNAATTGGDG